MQPATMQQGQPVYVNASTNHAERLRCCTIFLGLLGLLQLVVGPVQGIAALCSLCQVGCCTGPTIETKIVEAAKSIQCKAYTVTVFAIIYIIGTFVFGSWFCNSACGIVIMDKTDPVQFLAFGAGNIAIGVGEVAYKAAELLRGVVAEVHITEHEIGNIAATLVYPFEVCDYIDGVTSSSNGIYFPRPLSTFGTYIQMFLLATNGLMLLFAVASAFYASKILKAQIRNVTRDYGMTATRGMPVVTSMSASHEAI